MRTTMMLCAGLLILSACNRPATQTPVQTGADLVYTAAAQTVEAQMTESASDRPPTSTMIPAGETETPSATELPTSTSLPIGESPVPTEEATEIPCDRASFVDDVTIPDGTVIEPGATFEKTWRLKNTGSCSWDSSYSLIFDSGDAMGGPASSALTKGVVAPGQEVDITLELTAPTETGEYRGNWKLRSAGGVNFGIGPEGDKLFWVEIEVGSPTETPDVDVALAYETTHDCGGKPTLILQLDNTGSVRVDSAELTVTLLSDDSVIFGPEADNEPFIAEPTGCPPDGDTIRPGRTRYLGAILDSLPAPGTDVKATAKICTEENLGGTCVEESVEFAIP